MKNKEQTRKLASGCSKHRFEVADKSWLILEKYGIIFLMEKIIITATAESIEQVEQLLEAGVDRIYVGEKDFGLRLPTTFSYDQLREIANLVHDAGKELIVAVNAFMHQHMLDCIKPFFAFLAVLTAD